MEPQYHVDETRIEAAHDQIISASPELSDHLALINDALDFMHRMVIAEAHKDAGELVLLRLSVRCFNSAAASLRLVRCGYWQPAFSVMRDLLETLFLLDYLDHDRKELLRWYSLPDKERRKAFKPVSVREKLDARDGFTERKRQQAYDLLSQYAAHPTPEGFTVISPNAMMQVGPFPSEKNLKAALQELAKHVANVSVLVGAVVKAKKPEELARKVTYYGRLQLWSEAYLKPKAPAK